MALSWVQVAVICAGRDSQHRADVMCYVGEQEMLTVQLLQVFLVKQMMEQEGVDLMLDVHGDEDLPYNFISGNEGIPGWTPRLAQLQVLVPYFPPFLCKPSAFWKLLYQQLNALVWGHQAIWT